jgi:hypothetical protein
MNERKLKALISEAVEEALTVEITWEKRHDENTGVPLAAPELRKEKIFLPAFLTQHLKFQEGAFRGLQEDVSKKNNEISELTKKVNAIGNVLIGMESSAKRLAGFSDAIRLLQNTDVGIIDEGHS